MEPEKSKSDILFLCMMLLDEIDPLTALKAGLVVSLFADQTKTMSVMQRKRLSDLLFSGSMEELAKLKHRCDCCSIRAESGETTRSFLVCRAGTSLSTSESTGHHTSG